MIGSRADGLERLFAVGVDHVHEWTVEELCDQLSGGIFIVDDELVAGKLVVVVRDVVAFS